MDNKEYFQNDLNKELDKFLADIFTSDNPDFRIDSITEIIDKFSDDDKLSVIEKLADANNRYIYQTLVVMKRNQDRFHSSYPIDERMAYHPRLLADEVIQNRLRIFRNDLITYKKNVSKSPSKSLPPPEFKDYFQNDIKDIQGLKEYLSTLKGKNLACAMYILIDKYKVRIPEQKKQFVGSFKDVKEISAENTAFNKIIGATKHKDRDYKIIDNELVKYF